MSTTLKLSGIRTYMSALLYHINLQKGDVIRVSDDVAGKIGGLHRMSDNDGIKIFFFESVPDSTPLTYDFTNPAVIADAANRAADSDYMRRAAANATKAPEAETKEAETQEATQEATQAAQPQSASAEEKGPEDSDPAPAAAGAPASGAAEEKPAEAPAVAVAAPVAARKRAGQRAATK